MDFERVVFSGHAVRRMFRRGLTKDDVLTVLRKGEIIARYPDDSPYPSCMVLGFMQSVPIHVVAGLDEVEQTAIVVTAYVPDPQLWTEDFRTRREP